MKKSLLIIACMITAIFVNAKTNIISDDGELRGKITDQQTGQPMPFASVAIIRADKIVTSTSADSDGKYKIKPLSPGAYHVKATFVGYNSTTISDVIITTNNITYLNILISNDNTLPEIDIIYTPPLVDPGQVTPTTIIPSHIIKNMPAQTIEDMAATAPRVFQSDSGGSLYFRGSRESGTQYIVDGIKMTENFRISKHAIAQISVITGGIPAQFGDVTGGIVIITTKSYAGR